MEVQPATCCDQPSTVRTEYSRLYNTVADTYIASYHGSCLEAYLTLLPITLFTLPRSCHLTTQCLHQHPEHIP